MNQFIEKYQNELAQSENFLKKDLLSLRTGRANPTLVENILVDSYGVKTPLQHLASIHCPNSRQIIIQPWDKNLSKEIERGILASNIGLNPVNEGAHIRLNLPSMTEEERKNLVKLLNQKVEQAKIKLRLIRDKIREEIFASEKGKAITQDDKFNYLKELDEFIKKQNDSFVLLEKNKEKEIMTL